MYQHHMQALEPRQLFATILDLPDAFPERPPPSIFEIRQPNVTMKARGITANRIVSQVITVTFSGFNQVDVATLNDRDLRVTGPDRFRRYAKLDSFVILPGGTTVARYKLTAPTGRWDSRDNGTYTVSLVQTAVRDIQGNNLLPRKLGTFRVAIPPPVEG